VNRFNPRKKGEGKGGRSSPYEPTSGLCPDGHFLKRRGKKKERGKRGRLPAVKREAGKALLKLRAERQERESRRG